MEETQNPEMSSQFAPAPRRKINKRFIYIVVAVLAVVLLFVGFNFLNSKKGNDLNSDINTSANPSPELTATATPFPTEEETPTPTKEPSPTPSDTPTPKPTSNPVDKTTGLDRSKLSVTVQNGSGQAGVAGKGADLLKQLGYNVVGTANAGNFDYTNVSVNVKSADSEYLDLLKKDLGTEYTVASTSSNLESGFSSDALVIIGK